MGVESEGLRPTSVMIVDDQRYARLGLALMIRKAPDLRVVAEAGDGQEALEVLERLNRSTGLPDVVLMDVRMPGMDGISATRAMARRFPTVKVLVLTTYDEDDYAFGALEVGASGFLLKDSTAPELIAGVKAVARGDSVVAPSATRRLLRHWISQEDRAAGAVSGRREALAAGSGAGRGADAERLALLTTREKEILTLVGRALSNREIAETVVLAESTVKTYINRLLRKLSMRDRAGLIVLAYETGLVRPGQDE